MKQSFALSLIAHTILLIFLGIHLTDSVPVPRQYTETIPITLLPIDQTLSLQQGSPTTSFDKEQTPAPKPTTKQPEEEEARHIGDERVDSLTPFKVRKKLQKSHTIPANTAPSSSEKTDPPDHSNKPLEQTNFEEGRNSSPKTEEKPILPKPDKPETKPNTKPELKPTPEPEPNTEPELKPTLEPKPKAELHEVSPQKTPRNEPQSDIKPQKALPIPQHKPQKLPTPPLPQKAQASEKKDLKTIEDILALDTHLLNHTRTQGGGAKRSNTPEAFGAQKKVSNTEKMAQTLVDIAGTCIQKKLKLVAIGSHFNKRPIVRLQFYLNKEGRVVGDPIIDPLSGDSHLQDIMKRQVRAAVFSCQPYADLPRDQYHLWGQGFDFNVDPLKGRAPLEQADSLF